MITPWYAGQTLPIWPITITPDSGTLDLTNLSSTALKLRFINKNTLQEYLGTGAVSIIQNSNPAKIQYAPVANDSAIIGTYKILLEITYPAPNSGLDVFVLSENWEVNAR